MNSKSFNASSWLNLGIQKLSPSDLILKPIEDGVVGWHTKFPTFNNKALEPRLEEESQSDCTKFKPSRFLIPGWRGDSLPSREIGQFLKIFEELKSDARDQLTKSRDLNRSLRLGIFNEFLAFANFHGHSFENVDDPTSFWKELQNQDKELSPSFDQFLDVFCYRSILVLFLKIRFVSSLGSKSSIPTADSAFLYPSGFLSQIFKKGSSLELKSRAMESNVFGWYRPRENNHVNILDLSRLSLKISISEIIINTSSRVQGPQSDKKVYSHALSHTNFGLFLNSLLINMPLWMETLEDHQHVKHSMQSMEIISCKYKGDYLESLALSHWLAQENNKKMKWDQILCPDFKGDEFTSGLFMKICHELQFMSFLADSAEHQGLESIPYIAQVMGAHFSNRKNSQQKLNKTSMDESPFFSSTYDRVVLNLCHLPKTNPHHYLFSQISDQANFLKNDGYLYVFCHKDIFIQSQKDKVESLLNQLDLKGVLDLDHVKGKGELANRIYIFKKRKNVQISLGLKDKMPCHTWRFNAEMTSFHHFAEITEVLRSFYLSHIGDAPCLYQVESNELFRLEFFKDAIINGHLIQSSSNNNKTITHPEFFKKLIQSTAPIDKFFELREVNDADISDSQFVRWNEAQPQDLPYFLLIRNKRHQEVELSIHPMNLMASIKEKSADQDCFFYRIIPKNRDHNPMILDRYFKSQIGRQLIQMAFTNLGSKIKSQLSKLLVPQFFSTNSQLASHEMMFLNNLSPKHLSTLSSKEVQVNFSHLIQNFEGLFLNAPTQVLTTLHYFELWITQCLENQTTLVSDQSIRFDHPMIKKKLEGVATQPLFPHHPDIYIEFLNGIESLQNSDVLKSARLNQYTENEITFHTLDISNSKGNAIKLHSDLLMLQFIEFILKNAHGFPILKILKGLRLPSLDKLQEITEIDHSQIQQLRDAKKECSNTFDHVFLRLMFL